MSNQKRQRRRTLRRRFKTQLQARRHTQLFLAERRLSQLESEQEIARLTLENTHDLMTALEQKVQQLLNEKKQYQAQGARKPVIRLRHLGHWLRDLLGQKGNP